MLELPGKAVPSSLPDVPGHAALRPVGVQVHQLVDHALVDHAVVLAPGRLGPGLTPGMDPSASETKQQMLATHEEEALV
jgi:hypothetical protein